MGRESLFHSRWRALEIMVSNKPDIPLDAAMTLARSLAPDLEDGGSVSHETWESPGEASAAASTPEALVVEASASSGQLRPCESGPGCKDAWPDRPCCMEDE